MSPSTDNDRALRLRPETLLLFISLFMAGLLIQQHQATLPSTVSCAGSDRSSSVRTAPLRERNSTETSTTPASIDKKPTVSTPIRDFERSPEGVVIAVKIHGDLESVYQVKQSICLLNAAYNYRVHYDHVIFTTVPMNQSDVLELQQIAAPAKLQVVVDSKPLLDELALLPDEKVQHLVKRCNKTDVSELEWETLCEEEGSHLGAFRISYNWQAEFRSKHLWTHPALADYRYMLWFDSDAMCTKQWERDPIAFMIRNSLVMLFDHFPQGLSRGPEIKRRLQQAFNQTICGIEVENGHLIKITKKPCPYALHQIHGFFHITDLDFYRSPEVLNWANILIGEEKYSRLFDDQIMVTGAAAALAPERSWYMLYHGFNLQVMHNGHFDGIREARYHSPIKGKRWFKGFWEDRAPTDFPAALPVCKNLIVHGG